MPLIAFVVLLSEILFVIRTADIFRERRVLDEWVVTKTGTAAIASLCWISFFFATKPMLQITAGLTVTVSALLALAGCERQRLSGLRARVPILLDRWILNLRLGQSVKAARDAALREESEILQALLRPLFETRGGERREHPLLPHNIRKELEQLNADAHAPLARLENIRRVMSKTSEFRRKSGQAVRQSAIQAVVMLILLLALSALTLHRYGWTRSGGEITSAWIMSLTGVILMIRLARKAKWKL